MNFPFKFIFLLIPVIFCKPVSATTYTIKTVGTEFTPDTVYANVGDSIKFIISIGHDVIEITDSAYANNTIAAYPGGFNYNIGTFYFIIDSVQIYYYACTYHMASSQMKGVIIADGSTFIEESDKSNLISVFPNPVTDKLVIQSNEEITQAVFCIYNIKGQTELTGILSYSNEIDVSSLVPGYYFIEFLLPERKKSVNFMKN